MKALILAAGYATRLYPLTENQPKPLLKVNGKPIVEHILERIKDVAEIEEILVITNHRFYDYFRVWLNHLKYPKKIKLINDGTISNDDRLGAVGDINHVLKEENINGNLLVIGGDNLFGFSLQRFINFFKAKDESSVVALYDLKELERVKGKFGVGVLERDQVVNFEEKPLKPKSTFAATACYIFNENDLKLVEKSIEQGKADNPGDLIKFLVKNSQVHGFVFDEHWFDIGSFESLKEAEKFYSERHTGKVV